MTTFTSDDIIRMAREAGMEVHDRKGQVRIGSAVLTGCDSTDQVERFAALVAAAEREACAQVALQIGEVMADRYGVAAECITTAEAIEEAIRARGTAPSTTEPDTAS